MCVQHLAVTCRPLTESHAHDALAHNAQVYDTPHTRHTLKEGITDWKTLATAHTHTVCLCTVIADAGVPLHMIVAPKTRTTTHTITHTLDITQ